MHIELLLRLDGEIRAPGGAVAIGRTLALLRAVAETGSVQGAARRLGVSYRAAWGQLRTLEAALGQAPVAKTKGHGSVLTAFGARLSAELEEAQLRAAAGVEAERSRLEERIRGLFGGPPRLRLAASHDPLLVGVVEAAGTVDLSVSGSLDALDRLAAGDADAAGFHFGAEEGAPPPFDRTFRDPSLAIRPLFRREQGLMLAPGDALGLRSIADVARRRARFVNRQRGAGTRIWFERLCREQDVRTDDIVGFHTEEFTHKAVAALIAAGAADVGMGTRAAADAFGLDYRPLGWETYYLAASPSADPAILETFAEMISDAARGTAGYGPPHHSNG
jgi:molybdate transport repressor ModE-like protein